MEVKSFLFKTYSILSTNDGQQNIKLNFAKKSIYV